MNVLYLTNKEVEDKDLIPYIIRKSGDRVFSFDSRFSLDDIKQNNINFIVCDRPKFLLSDEILNFLPRKAINIHPSFLPWNKGYYPNYWSIKTNTPHGTTIHFIDSGIDTGDIIAQVRINLFENDTLKTNYKRLRKLSVGLFSTIWSEVRLGKMMGIKQNKNEGSHYYKKDFEGILESLPFGWDTKISDL